MSPFLISGMILSLMFALFFSIMESTYQAANKLQLELERRLGRFQGRILSFFAHHPAWFIGTTLVGSTVTLVIFTTLFCIATAPYIASHLPTTGGSVMLFLIQSLAAAATILLVCSLLPKLFSSIDPNTTLYKLSVPFYFSFILLFVITFPLIALSRYLIVRVLGMKYDKTRPFFGTPDIRQYQLMPQPETENIVLDRKIFHNALEFKTVKIRECMVPRTEITAVELNDPVDKLREAFVESGHSKVIIYKQSIDEIIGYCHSSSMFKRPEEIREILTPIIIVAETASANELVIRFLRERKSLAVVMDEFGGTSGIVSMEDIIEEIFGEIDDERDEENETIEQQIDEATFLLSARLEIEYLNETYSWDLPTGEYETLGGLILAYTEDFPKQGQTIKLPPFTFTIQATGNNRIDTVKVKINS